MKIFETIGENRRMFLGKLPMLALIGGVMLVGCQSHDSAGEQLEEAGEEIKDKADDVVDATEEAVEDAKDTVD